MKKLFFVLVVISFSFSLTQAQASKDGWALGFGLVSPRIFGDVDAENFDFGGQFLIQKNINEYIGLRLNVDYLKFTGKPTTFTNDAFSFGVSGIYNFMPCGIISPYFGVGGSVLYYTLKNSVNVTNKSYFGELSADIIFGGVLNISEDWFLKAELAQHTLSTDKFDGTKATGGGGIFGGSLDSYVSVNLGLLYYFDPGTKSTYCEEVAGLSNSDFSKIEEIVRKYAATPTTVDYNRIEDIVKKNAPSSTVKEVRASCNWVLVGVNFESGKSSLSSESYPILVNAVQVLLSNPDMKVEVQGHTDNIGSESFNKKLSEQRAETVKRFLVAKGVPAARLSTVGVGSSNPVADNKTAEGRSLNRRIEFKVLGK